MNETLIDDPPVDDTGSLDSKVEYYPDPDISNDKIPSDSDLDYEQTHYHPTHTADISNCNLEDSFLNDAVDTNLLNQSDLTDSIWNDMDGEAGLSEIFGEPQIDTKYWHMQENPDTCAIVSQEYILDRWDPDHGFTEEQLIKEAVEKGYYFPGSGTYPADVGKLLEDHGIQVERTENNDITNLRDKLENNQKVIVAVDCNEIWANSLQEQLNDLYYYPEANHALEVIGYNDETRGVILNDPGHPEGRGMEVSLADFKNAWEDSNYFMVSTKDPAPSVA